MIPQINASMLARKAIVRVYFGIGGGSFSAVAGLEAGAAPGRRRRI